MATLLIWVVKFTFFMFVATHKSRRLAPLSNYADPQATLRWSIPRTNYQEDGSSDIWVLDLSRQTFGRRTFNELARNPKWSRRHSTGICRYRLGNLVNQCGWYWRRFALSDRGNK